MPLSSIGESGHYELYGNNVYFFMTYKWPPHPVRHYISGP
jgi:hypothetical protein